MKINGKKTIVENRKTILVRVVSEYPQIANKTYSDRPQSIEFTTEPVDACDYLIVINKNYEKIKIKCQASNIWKIIQEPPVDEFEDYYEFSEQYSRIYTPNTNRTENKYIHTHGSIPWFVGSYDFLKSTPIPNKNLSLSWVTNADNFIEGQRKRLQFLEYIQGKVDFDLFGKDFNPIDNKWDGVAPYKYSLAVENYSGLYYWSEKIADCFLCYTMPIYYGCTNITEYFPEESLIMIDINQPEESIKIIQEAIKSDLWIRNRDAIIHARELVLEKYNLFAMLDQEIRKHQLEIKYIEPNKQEIICLKTSKSRLRNKLLTSFFNIFFVITRNIIPRKIRNFLWDKVGKKIWLFCNSQGIKL